MKRRSGGAFLSAVELDVAADSLDLERPRTFAAAADAGDVAAHGGDRAAEFIRVQQLAGDVAARGGERKALRIDLVQLQIAACRVGLDARGGDIVQVDIAARGVQRQHAGELRVPYGNAPTHGRKARALRLHIRNIHISRGRAGCYRAAAGRADKNISARDRKSVV